MGKSGVLPDQAIRQMIADGAISASQTITDDQIQPASLDLRLGETAYRVRASFLTGQNRKVADRLPQRMVEGIEDDAVIEQLLDLLASEGEAQLFGDMMNFFVIAIKPFQDPGNYDQHRIDSCCTHVVNRAGEVVSLCEYNILGRQAERA